MHLMHLCIQCNSTCASAGIAILRAEIKPTLAVCGLTKLASFASVVVGEGGDLLGVGEGGDSEAPSQEVQVRTHCCFSSSCCFCSPEPGSELDLR